MCMSQKSNTVDTLTPVTADNSGLVETQEVEYCANCGVLLNGKFCHSCGQSSKSMIKFFGEVAKELLDDALGYDSRMKHSIVPLLLKPGRITLDYIKGKRFHYVLPFKLYLITSVLFILLVKSTANTDDLKFGDTDASEESQKIAQELTEEINKAVTDAENANDAGWMPKIIIKTESDEIENNSLNEEISTSSDSLSDAAINEDAIEDQNESENNEDGEFNLSWDDETQQLTGFETLDDGWFKTFLTVISPKIKTWKKDAGPLVKNVIELLPYMMFVILPIFAIFLKGFYVFSRRYYTEHLVFLLHNHSFIYMMLMIQIVMGLSYEKLNPMQNTMAQFGASTIDWLSTIVGIWMVVYVFLAMKRFYRQGWGATIAKTIALSFGYFIMLAFGFLATIAYGAYQA